MYQDVTSTFESFYTGTSPRLLRFAYGLTGDMAEAQDLAQEAYARAWPRWKRLRRYENPESWLRLVVTRLAVDRLRWLGVRRVRAPRESAVVPPPDEEMLTLVAALKQLPMTQRKALVLHYFLDMPVAEIAAETGTNVNTVKTWLSRGRANVAAHLTAVTPNDIQGVREKAHRRRNRTVATSITAFLATAAATAAAFLIIPDATPPVLRPDLVLPYSGQPFLAGTLMMDERAIAFWLGTDGTGHLGAIEPSTGNQSWPPIELGTVEDGLVPIGIRDGIMVVLGDSESVGTGLSGVDLKAGRILWQRPPQRNVHPMLDVQPGAVTGREVETGIIGIVAESEVSGLDWRTGRPVWTIASPPGAKYSGSSKNSFAQVEPGGVLRIRDLGTGRVTSERSGVPEVETHDLKLLDGWLYLRTAEGILRMPVTGSEPASLLIPGGDNLEVLLCGRHVCVAGENFVAAFDRQTGKQLWRKETSSSYIGAGDLGTILTVASDGVVILDPDGRDITPDSLGNRVAYWIDNENLLVHREIERVMISGGLDQMPLTTFELGVYSMVTHQEVSLGRHQLYGNCAGLPGRYVCPGKDGYILIH